jgi:signal transduction histidine kinase
MGRLAQRRTYLLFALLALYIVLQFIWWAVLLVRRDQQMALLALEVRALGGSPSHGSDPGRGMRMIMGEGIVFLVIVLVVLYFTWRAIRRDLALARSQRNFLMAVTHELRSPIAGIKLQLQTLARPGLDHEVRDRLRLQALQEVDRLGELTEKVLQATSSEEKIPSPDLEKVDLMKLMRTVVERAGAQLAPGHVLLLEGPEGVEAVTDPESIRIIAENLIENAAKYSPEGSTIQVEVIHKREGWRITVCDEGPGVPPEDRERIFDKFYRSGNEETRRTKGTGLGLYIVQRLARTLGGAVDVRDREGGGSIFVASFPNQ